MPLLPQVIEDLGHGVLQQGHVALDQARVRVPGRADALGRVVASQEPPDAELVAQHRELAAGQGALLVHKQVMHGAEEPDPVRHEEPEEGGVRVVRNGVGLLVLHALVNHEHE
eukprot:1044723-Lingulodinium_polyedra.AAC.1